MSSPRLAAFRDAVRSDPAVVALLLLLVALYGSLAIMLGVIIT